MAWKLNLVKGKHELCLCRWPSTRYTSCLCSLLPHQRCEADQARILTTAFRGVGSRITWTVTLAPSLILNIVLTCLYSCCILLSK